MPGVLTLEGVLTTVRRVFVLSAEGGALKDSELLDDGVYIVLVLTGGGGGALGLVSSTIKTSFLCLMFLASSSDASVEEVNIFLCAFLNSAISMSCFSFLSVMNGDFFVAVEVPADGSDKDGIVDAAASFIQFLKVRNALSTFSVFC